MQIPVQAVSGYAPITRNTATNPVMALKFSSRKRDIPEPEQPKSLPQPAPQSVVSPPKSLAHKLSLGVWLAGAAAMLGSFFTLQVAGNTDTQQQDSARTALLQEARDHQPPTGAMGPHSLDGQQQAIHDLTTPLTHRESVETWLGDVGFRFADSSNPQLKALAQQAKDLYLQLQDYKPDDPASQRHIQQQFAAYTVNLEGTMKEALEASGQPFDPQQFDQWKAQTENMLNAYINTPGESNWEVLSWMLFGGGTVIALAGVSAQAAATRPRRSK